LTVKAYWAGNFCAAYLCVVGLCFVLVGMLFYKQQPGLTGNIMPLLIVEVFLYPIGLVLMSFNVSLLFKSFEMAVKVLPMINMVAGSVPTIVVSQLWLNFEGTPHTVGRAVHIVMSLINPIYSLPGMMVVGGMEGMKHDYSVADYFQSWAAFPLAASPIAILLYAGNIVLQDSRSYYTTPGELARTDNSRKDEDVLEEEARVARTPQNNAAPEAACYHNLSHTYRGADPSKKCGGACQEQVETQAVRGISLGIRPGECFGLLGPNGAGKTTTLSILTGEVNPPTAGHVSIFGNDMSSGPGMSAAYEMLGLCPQVDPLWEFISGREHLLFYGRVKGVPEADLGAKVSALLFRLGFEVADSDKAAGQYSGGMKRKLSVGISLIGQSPLLFLDEPSAAVDAGAKRHLWKVIKRRAPTQTVVLTTHSMEEAEALCDRIAIQVKGQLRCLGTPSHIKKKYGSGYQLDIFCSAQGQGVTAHEMTTFLQTKLSPEITLLENHAGHYLYQLPSMGRGSSLSLGKVFSEMQDNMQAMRINEYSLAQPSLEQVFIRFAREQDQADESSIELPNAEPPV